MKVKDLIKKLEKMNPEATVIAYSYANQEDFKITDVEKINVKNRFDDKEIKEKIKPSQIFCSAEFALMQGEEVVYLS